MKYDIGKIVRYHRKEAGITQVELAELSGVGKTVIFDIENGKESIRLSTLLKVLQVLNIDIDLKSPIMNKVMEVINEKS